MRLLFVADLHYSLKQFDWLLAQSSGYDVTIIGGDLLDLSSGLDLDLQIAVVEKYLRLLRQATCLVICSGNHDGDSRNAADESIAQWLAEARADRLHVDGDSFDLGDSTRITVCPWWDGDLSRAQLEAQLQSEADRQNRRAASHVVSLPDKIDPATDCAPGSVRPRWIWVHHAPPEGARTCFTGRKYAGDEYLRGWIERFQPDMVLGGHIHNSPFYDQGSWIDRIGRTWVFNPGRQIGPQPTTIAIDLQAMTAEWVSNEARSLRSLRIA